MADVPVPDDLDLPDDVVGDPYGALVAGYEAGWRAALAWRSRTGPIEEALAAELDSIGGDVSRSALGQGALKLARVLDRRPDDDGAQVTARTFDSVRAALREIRRLAHDAEQRKPGTAGELGTPVWDIPDGGPPDVGPETGGGRDPAG